MMLPSYFIQIGSKMCGVQLGLGIFNRKFMMRIPNISWLTAQMQPIRTSSVLNMKQILIPLNDKKVNHILKSQIGNLESLVTDNLLMMESQPPVYLNSLVVPE